MITTWNVASATKPRDFNSFVAFVKESAAEHGKLQLVAFVLAAGPGCNNYGMMLEGEEAEAKRFVEAFTLAVMPAKYGRSEGDPAIHVGQFEVL